MYSKEQLNLTFPAPALVRPEQPIADNLIGFYSTVRSGTGAFGTALCNARRSNDSRSSYAVGTFSNQLAKSALKETGRPNFEHLFGDPEKPNKKHLFKETLDPRHPAWASLWAVPQDRKAEFYEKIPLLIMVRDPAAVVAALMHRGWLKTTEPDPNNPSNAEYFLELLQLAYASLRQMYEEAKAFRGRVASVAYGDLIRESEYGQKKVFTNICTHFGLPFSDSVLDWSRSYDDLVNRGIIRGGGDMVTAMKNGSYLRTQRSSHFEAKKRLLDLDETELEAVRSYTQMWHDYEYLRAEGRNNILRGTKKRRSKNSLTFGDAVFGVQEEE